MRRCSVSQRRRGEKPRAPTSSRRGACGSGYAEKLAETILDAAERAKELERPEHRMAAVLAAINRFLEQHGLGRVVIVGGFAVELLTGGATRTLDVDLVAEGYCASRVLEEALRMLRTRLPAAARGPVVPLSGAEKALDLVASGKKWRFQPLRVDVDNFGWFYLEAPEELVLRYLRERVHWGTEEARRRIILLLGVLGPEMRLEELREAAKQEGEELYRELEDVVRLLRRRGLL